MVRPLRSLILMLTSFIQGLPDPVAGSVDAQWSINQASAGGTVVLVSGYIAGEGFSAGFTWSQDEQGVSSGSWVVPGINGYGGSFSIDFRHCRDRSHRHDRGRVRPDHSGHGQDRRHIQNPYGRVPVICRPDRLH